MIEEIYTIASREIKKLYTKKYLLFLYLIIDIGLIFLIGSSLENFVDIKRFNISYTKFFGPSIITLIVSWGASNIGYNIIEDKRGSIKQLLVAPISRYSILFGKILAQMLNNLILFSIIIFIFLAITKSMNLLNFIFSLGLLFLIIFGFYGFGLWFGSLFKNTRSFREIFRYISFFLILTSGALQPINTMPEIFRNLVYLNPLTYSIDALRFTLFGFSEINFFVDVLILFIFCFLGVFFGTYFFEKNLRDRY